MVVSWISKIQRQALSLRAHPQVRLLSGTHLASSADSDSAPKEPVDPFVLIAYESSVLAESLRSMVTTKSSLISAHLRSPNVQKVTELTSATGYFFRGGVEGKKMCPTILFLMAKSFNPSIPMKPLARVKGSLELWERQQRIAEITEIIHVASPIHDDVLDEADIRRGICSLNFENGNKLAILAGDFLLFRAFGALASLKNTEAVSLMATAVENLVKGETMQEAAISQKCCSMEFYMQKTYNKTASLISNSCKALALLSDQTVEVAELAFEYGKNLGLAYQLIDDILDFTGSSASLGKASLSDLKNGIITAPMLFAMEEFPELHDIVYKSYEDPAYLNSAVEHLKKSKGIQRTRELAKKHSELAVAAIESLPETDGKEAREARRALMNLTQRVLVRKK